MYEEDYDFVNMTEDELENLSYSGNLEFKYLSEEQLSQISSRIPDEVYLAALNIAALDHRIRQAQSILNDICDKHNISPHNAMLAVSAVEQSYENELRRLQEAEEEAEEDEMDDLDAACNNLIL
jgi:hypothetical protein